MPGSVALTADWSVAPQSLREGAELPDQQQRNSTCPLRPQPRPPGRSRHWLNRRVAVTAVAGLAAQARRAPRSSPTPPSRSFPNNVVVFPDRDFVTIEGYQTHVGETALVEVTRGGQVIGSAKGVVEEGDVAFEVNHPGGYCWGAGTGLNVTPDIRAGRQGQHLLQRHRRR